MTREPSVMVPVRFGLPSRQSSGLFHPPATGAVRAECVVVCNPLGQEAIRAHRLLRAVAERLAEHGFPVLRFDYHGTGDADGDESSASLGAWADDVLKADLEARRLSGHPHTAWLGVRLGATLAAMASAQARMSPRRLVLWDPVLEGRPYLEGLFRSQREHLEAARVAQAWSPMDDGDTEVLGFAIPAALRREILALDGAAVLAGCRTPHVVALASDAGADHPILAAAERSGRLRVQRTGAPIVWDTDEAIDAAVVPKPTLEAIVRCMTSAA